MAVVQKRAEVKLSDIDALMRHGVDACRPGGHRRSNPLITLKALSFDDVPALSAEVRERLGEAVKAVDVGRLPVLTPYAPRQEDDLRR